MLGESDRVYRAGVFRATALPGPVAGIAKAGGDGQTAAVNRQAFSNLVALVADQYGNGIRGDRHLTVESGPVAFVTVGGATEHRVKRLHGPRQRYSGDRSCASRPDRSWNGC